MGETMCHSKVCREYMDDHFEEVRGNNIIVVKFSLKFFCLFNKQSLCWWITGKSTHMNDITCQGFWYFARLRSREIPRNLVEILSNTCLYSNFETCLSYWGYLLAVNLQIYVKTSSLKHANNVPKLPGVDYVAKNWALAMMLKALPLFHFWRVLLLTEQMMTSVRKTLKTLVWSVQNWSISSKICPENNHKIRRFFNWLLSGQVCPPNSRKIPAKFPQNRPIFLWVCP